MLIFKVLFLLPRLNFEILECMYPDDDAEEKVLDIDVEGSRCHIMTSDDTGCIYGQYLSHRGSLLSL